MIGDIRVIGGVHYFQANRQGTLVKLAECSFWRKFWLELRDCFKKWEMNEAIEYAKGGKKSEKRKVKSSSKDL